jgi:hypothetical protein
MKDENQCAEETIWGLNLLAHLRPWHLMKAYAVIFTKLPVQLLPFSIDQTTVYWPKLDLLTGRNVY